MSSPLRSACVGHALVLALVGASLVGCSGSDEPPATAAAHDAVTAITRALDSRARVVRRADADAFDRLIGGAPSFRDQQDTWFANLTQLPLQRLAYKIDPASLVRDGDSYTVTAEVSIQLEGYDSAPAISQTRLRFHPARRHPGRFLLTSVDPRSPQPWDLDRIEVREQDGVLGVFDPGSVDAAPELMSSVVDGVTSVAGVVPYDWNRNVVLYALSDPAFLLSLKDVPGDDPEDLDAVSFPVGESTRFALNPRMLDRPGRERDQLVRHELTHVAVGAYDDAVPVWLSEGLAEYVAARPLAPEDRRVPAAAVRAAELGVPDLPDDATFNDDDSDAHYGLAWWAVEYLATTYGDAEPWQLLDAMAVPGADPDQVLRERYGMTTRDLVAQAERMILALYDRS